MLLMYGWLIVKNRCAREELPAEPEPVKASAPEAEPEDTDTVIEAAPDEPSPEPTIEAPTRRPKAAPETDEVEQIIKEYNK